MPSEKAAFVIDEASHSWTSASCHPVVSSSLSVFEGLEHDVVHSITATLQLDWPFLSCCDQINLDGFETMNDDITIWAPATCRSKNQFVFGQNKRLQENPVCVTGLLVNRLVGENWMCQLMSSFVL